VPLPGWRHAPWAGGRLWFDRQEISGAFGDLGTDPHLLTGMVPADADLEGVRAGAHSQRPGDPS
jgi:hypothetical protein